MFPISLCTQYATHTLNIPISNHSFSKDNWALYPSLLVEPPLQNANRRFLFSARHHFMREWTEEEIMLRAGMAQSTGYSTNLKPTSPLADEIVWALVLLLLLADMPWPLLATSFKMEVEPNLLLPPSFTSLLIPLPTMFKQGSTCLPCAPLTHPPTTRSSSAAGGRDLCNQL